jgi:hypothetical protein
VISQCMTQPFPLEIPDLCFVQFHSLLWHTFYYFLSSFACFSLLYSLPFILAFAHDISHILLCNFIIIHSYKIPLFICYVTCHGFTYVGLKCVCQ